MRKVLKYTLLAANFLFVVCLFLGVLSTKISPERSIILPYFGLAFPFFVALNICWAVFWLCIRRWWFVVSLAAVIATWSYTNTIFPFAFPKKATDEQTLSVMSYNVLLFDHGRGFDSIFSVIRAQNPDVVCLQEFGFYRNDKGERLRKRVFDTFAKHYPYRHVWYKNQFKRLEYGVVTFSKYPIAKKQKVNYQSRNNISIFSDIVVGGDTVRVFNNHLESVKFSDNEKHDVVSLNSDELLSQETLLLTESLSRKLGKAFKIRAKQADCVAAAVRQSPYKTIVCGDFNDMPMSYAYHKIKGEQRDLYVATSCGFDYTFHDMAMYLRIDHIFASAAFTPLSCKIVHTDFSDHDPVVARIGLKKRD